MGILQFVRVRQGKNAALIKNATKKVRIDLIEENKDHVELGKNSGPGALE